MILTLYYIILHCFITASHGMVWCDKFLLEILKLDVENLDQPSLSTFLFIVSRGQSITTGFKLDK